jgi:hypothetical protein
VILVGFALLSLLDFQLITVHWHLANSHVRYVSYLRAKGHRLEILTLLTLFFVLSILSASVPEVIVITFFSYLECAPMKLSSQFREAL